MEQINCDVAVIGAGPAGLAVAKSAYENGAKEVILIERDKYLSQLGLPPWLRFHRHF